MSLTWSIHCLTDGDSLSMKNANVVLSSLMLLGFSKRSKAGIPLSKEARNADRKAKATIRNSQR